MQEREVKKEALIKTMTFFDIFDMPLTKEEACDFILYKNLTLNELQEFIDHEKFIIENDNHIYFRNRSLCLRVRKDKEIHAQKLIRKAKRFVQWMQMIPFVRTVALCNSLSFYSAEKDSDIDLFIITEKNRLFTARLFALIFVLLCGIRRSKSNISGRFCLSFIISKDKLNIEDIKHKNDIYLTFWLRLMRPLIGQKTYREFINENKWINQYFNYKIDQQKHLLDKSDNLLKLQKILEWPLKGILGNLIEKIFASWQKNRANKKIKNINDPSGIIVCNHMLKFHNVDMREKYQHLWNLRYNHFKKYLNSSSPLEDDFSSLDQSRSHQSRILYEAHSQDNAYKKNETHSPDSQKV
jgi:hypothetical protein